MEVLFQAFWRRKISTFFEKIGSHHFNANDQDVNDYNISKVIHRFNNIFPWIGNGDHFIDKYDIPIPETFDYVNKYALIDNNGIKYSSSINNQPSTSYLHILSNENYSNNESDFKTRKLKLEFDLFLFNENNPNDSKRITSSNCVWGVAYP